MAEAGDGISLYLVWFSDEPAGNRMSWTGDAQMMNAQLWLVRTGCTRSRLYHATKRQLPKGAALLVAPLEDHPDGWPKFMGMTAGVTAWLRRTGAAG